MDDFFSQYQWSVVEMVTGLISISFLFTVCSQIRVVEPVTFLSIDQTTKGAQVEYSIPVVEEGDFIVDNAILEMGSYFNWKDYVHVQSDSISLLDYVSVNGVVDTQNTGEYKLNFILHYNGTTIVKEATYYVVEERK